MGAPPSISHRELSYPCQLHYQVVLIFCSLENWICSEINLDLSQYKLSENILTKNTTCMTVFFVVKGDGKKYLSTATAALAGKPTPV